MAKDALEQGGTAYEGGGDEEFTFRWLRIALTADDPIHVWHAGKGYTDDAFDGFSVQTDAHVWMEARGGGETPDGGGTFLAQSVGQHWMQSQEGPLSMVAGNNVVFGTGSEAKSGFKLASFGGLTVVADSRITASTATPTDPTAALDAETNAGEVGGNWGTWWTTVDTAAALGLNVLDRVLAKALSGSAGLDASFGSMLTATGMCANFAGAGANLYGMIGGAAGANTPPGMTVAGEAGIVIGSPIAVNVWGVPGALLGSMFATMFGGVSVGAIGGVDIGMASAGPIDMSSLVTASLSAVSRKTGVGIELASRNGSFEAEGVKGVTMASKAPTVVRALGTTTVESKAWMDLTAPKGAVSFKSQGAVSFSVQTGLAMGLAATVPELSKTVTALAPDDSALTAAPAPDVGQPQIGLTAAGGIEILAGAEASAPVLKITAQKVEILVGPNATGTMDAQSVELAVGQSTIKTSAESLKIDSEGVDFS